MSLDLDKRAWKRVAFGDVIESVTVRVDDPATAGVARYVGLEHLDPGVITVQRWDSPETVEAQKLRFQPGDVIFGRRRGYQRKLARADFEGICSAHALVLRARPDVMCPDFLPVFLSSEYFLARAIAISVGSLSPTVNWQDLDIQRFDLPPLDEQKRIAYLLWSVERHRLGLVGERDVLRAVLARFASERFASIQTSRRLADITSARSGPSFAAVDVSPVPRQGSIPVLGIPNTKPDGSIDLTGVGYVSGLPKGTATVDESSLILIRTNGNRERIGNIYLPPIEAHGCAVSAFQFLMKVHDPADREYVYWVLKQPGPQARMSEAASGTTGLGNLAVKWLNDQQIPWPEASSERSAIVDWIRIQVTAELSIQYELSTLSAFRSSTLAEIFGGGA